MSGTIGTCRAAVGSKTIATVAVPAVDTILIGDERGFLDSTPDRGRLWACQTPQVFRYDLLLRAHEEVTEDVTDDAAMVEIGRRTTLRHHGSRRSEHREGRLGGNRRNRSGAG